MPVLAQTVLLLVASNVFMTFAWYAHLKELNHKPWLVAALFSWAIALFEYLFQVPANRIGTRSSASASSRFCKKSSPFRCSCRSRSGICGSLSNSTTCGPGCAYAGRSTSCSAAARVRRSRGDPARHEAPENGGCPVSRRRLNDKLTSLAHPLASGWARSLTTLP